MLTTFALEVLIYTREFRGQEFRGQTGRSLCGYRWALRFEYKFWLASIRNDLFSGSALLLCQAPLPCLLQAMDEFGTSPWSTGVRTLARGGKLRFHLQCGGGAPAKTKQSTGGATVPEIAIPRRLLFHSGWQRSTVNMRLAIRYDGFAQNSGAWDDRRRAVVDFAESARPVCPRNSDRPPFFFVAPAIVLVEHR